MLYENIEHLKLSNNVKVDPKKEEQGVNVRSSLTLNASCMLILIVY